MGGKDGDKFKYFVRLCCRAFNFVRRHANLFMNLFIMVQHYLPTSDVLNQANAIVYLDVIDWYP